jgi:hypothetical protein
MMQCAEFEILLADYIDGALAPEQQAAFSAHLESCPGCKLLAEEAGSALAFMERVAEVDMPPAVMTKILHATNSGWELTLHGRGIRGWINRTFAPVLQPRFVLGAGLTIMTATMLTQCAGLPKRTLTAQDLDPVRIISSLENRAERVWDRAMKSYESMRLVYEVKSQINEWSQQQQEADEAAADANADSHKLNTNQATGTTR